MMASARVLALSSFSRSSPRAAASNLTSRRSMAGGGDHHGPPKVNLWEDPMNPSRWKEEHFVSTSLAVWGLLVYGGLKAFGGKKEKKGEAVPEAKHRVAGTSLLLSFIYDLYWK